MYSELIDKKRENIINRIKNTFEYKYFDYKKAIKEKGIYLRISLLGYCDFNCNFCHNEGAPEDGINSIYVIENILLCASNIGYKKIQFTGGEPLLYPHLDDLFELLTLFPKLDFGITTNGLHLGKNINKLSKSRIKRIHVSLINNEKSININNRWTLNKDLKNLIQTLAKKKELFINFPVGIFDVNRAQNILVETRDLKAITRVFAVINTNNISSNSGYLRSLSKMINEEMSFRSNNSTFNKVIFRGYSEPKGIRCKECNEKYLCLEKSRSLRFGADGVFRPCLASREWDIPVRRVSDYMHGLKASTILAIDF